MRLPEWCYRPTPNPDLLGRIDITTDEVEAESLKRHEEKLRRAKQYIEDRGLQIPAVYGKLEKA